MRWLITYWQKYLSSFLTRFTDSVISFYKQVGIRQKQTPVGAGDLLSNIFTYRSRYGILLLVCKEYLLSYNT